ncbi:MAG TPA: hypothetical protein VHB74_06060 [Devosia sp.]|nr:hypothetical protein [Devosia sp.]
MARLAFAIEGSIDIWELRYGYSVEAAIAQAMYPFIGQTVLIYRIAEMQGGYFGLARLLSITALRGSDRPIVVFEDVEMFSAPPDYPFGVTTLSRVQLLDDDEFDAIRRNGGPVPLAPGLAEQRGQPFIFERPDLDATAFMARARQAARGICALTGEAAGEALEVEFIWPKGLGAGLEADNVLLLSPSAVQAFHLGHFSARDDLSILVDVAALDRDLLVRINPTGRLIVPDDPAFSPAAENLAYHRRFRFRSG